MLDRASARPSEPPPPPPPPPPPDPAVQERARGLISRALNTDGVLWGAFQKVDRDEVKQVAAQLSELSGADAAQVIDRMAANGQLESFAKESVEGGGLFGGPDGLTVDERRAFLGGMASKLDGEHLRTLHDAYAKARPEHALEVADAVAAQAPVAAKLEFVQAVSADNRLHDGGGRVQGGFGSATFGGGDLDARSAGRVLASLRGVDAYQGFYNGLSGHDRQAIFAAAADVKTTTVAGHGGFATSFTTADPRPYAALMAAAQSIDAYPGAFPQNGTSPEQAAALFRAGVVSDGLTALQTLRTREGLGPREAGDMARSALGALDARSIGFLHPDSAGVMADALAKAPGGPGADFDRMAALPPSQARDALIQTTFLKTPAEAYARNPALADSAGRALASTFEPDPAKAAPIGREIAATLRTEEGRSLLSDQKVDAGARLWALRETAADPQGMRAAVAGSGGEAWESHALLARHATARTEQFSAARGNAAVALNGPADYANFVGAGLGAPLRADLPKDEAGLHAVQQRAAAGGYDFYQGVESVQKPAAGLAEAARQMGGGEVRVSVLPVQFSSQVSGPVELQLYRAEGANGQSRYVDNTGRVYADFNAWTNENKLPPGKMTYPTDGVLSEGGRTALTTRNTPDTSDTFWEHVKDVGDVAALIGGVAASGVLIFASGGTATPLVMGAWGLALGSAAWAGGRAYGELADRAEHGQTLSLSDPDARAAWLSLAGAGLTVAGAGVTRLATLAGNGTRLAANTARAAGIMNASANWADAAATADSAYGLYANWDRLSPAERAQAGLSIAFWGGMTGVSARTSGGSALDGFDFRTQINQAMISTGAAIKPPTLEGDAAKVVRDPRTGALSIERGPNASPESVRIHQEIASLMASDQSVGAMLSRWVARSGEPRPGDSGWNTKWEVEKLSREVQQLAEQANRPGLSAADKARLEDRAEHLSRDMARHQRDLQDLLRVPAQGDVESANTRRIGLTRNTTLGADEITLANTAGAGQPPRWEVRYGANVAVDPLPGGATRTPDQRAAVEQVAFLRRTAGELTAAQRGLTDQQASVGPGAPGTAARRASELVSARGRAAADLEGALNPRDAAGRLDPNQPGQARRVELATEALNAHVEQGAEAGLLYRAIRGDASLAARPPAEARAWLRTEAAAGRLQPAEINDMARLGWLNEGEVHAARTARGAPPDAHGGLSARTFDSADALNAEANRAAPFTSYTLVVRDAAGAETGRYTWTTDHLGRTKTVTGTVTGPEAGRSETLQRNIGNELGFVNGLGPVPNGARTATDVGFHLVADQVAGPTNGLNVVPGDGRVNNSEWKTRFETRIKDAAQVPGQRVEFRIVLDYGAGNATRRPDSFSPEYRTSNGGGTGRWIQGGTMPNVR